MRIAAITGHRPPKLGQSWNADGYADRLIFGDILETFEVHGITHVITGMVLGIDMAAAEVCAIFGFPFTAAVPFPGQENRWNTSQVARYNRLLDKATKVIQVSDSYSDQAFQTRNEWMVDHADVVLAWWDGSPGGTANCVKYAQGVRDTWGQVQGHWLSRVEGQDEEE